MANTRDAIGEKATLAGIVGNTLTSLEEDGVAVLGVSVLQSRTSLGSVKFPNVTKISQGAFSSCIGLVEIAANDFPNVTQIGIQAFDGCQNLVSARFPKLNTISSGSFSACKKFTHLILDSSTMATTSSNSFSGTPIEIGNGGIYVPSNLVATYKANANWSKYNIFPISEYPRSSFDSISDSWDTIISYANAGTIGDHYAVKDTKKLTIDDVDYYAQLIGINKDTLSSDGVTKANSTWMLKTLLSDSSGGGKNNCMNASGTAVGGWAETEMRNTTLPAILQTFPANLQSAIKSVNKVSYRYADTSEQTTADKLWIPSSQEVNLTGSYLKETTGVIYDGVFTNDASRTRITNNGGGYSWWLRSADSNSSFLQVGAYGTGTNSYAGGNYGVLLGFCI